MNSYFYVKWKDKDNKEYIVAFLAKKENRYYFIYNHNEKMLKEAQSKGFTIIPTFVDKKMYVSNNLFGFFKRRIPEENRIELWENLIQEYDECELLAITGAKSFNDDYSVERAIVNKN